MVLVGLPPSPPIFMTCSAISLARPRDKFRHRPSRFFPESCLGHATHPKPFFFSFHGKKRPATSHTPCGGVPCRSRRTKTWRALTHNEFPSPSAYGAA